MTPERAKQIIASQTDFPYWGNYRRTMTGEEIAEITDLWDRAQEWTSFATIVNRIARDVDPVKGDEGLVQPVKHKVILYDDPIQ